MSNVIQRSLAIGGFAAIVAFGGASAAESALPVHRCTPELQRLLQEWNEAGLQDVRTTTSKPGQAIVHDRNGHAYTAAAVHYMAYQIQRAIEDCQHGDVAAVQERVASLESALNRQG